MNAPRPNANIQYPNASENKKNLIVQPKPSRFYTAKRASSSSDVKRLPQLALPSFSNPNTQFINNPAITANCLFEFPRVPSSLNIHTIQSGQKNPHMTPMSVSSNPPLSVFTAASPVSASFVADSSIHLSSNARACRRDSSSRSENPRPLLTFESAAPSIDEALLLLLSRVPWNWLLNAAISDSVNPALRSRSNP